MCTRLYVHAVEWVLPGVCVYVCVMQQQKQKMRAFFFNLKEVLQYKMASRVLVCPTSPITLNRCGNLDILPATTKQ